MIEIGLFTE